MLACAAAVRFGLFPRGLARIQQITLQAHFPEAARNGFSSVAVPTRSLFRATAFFSSGEGDQSKKVLFSELVSSTSADDNLENADKDNTSPELPIPWLTQKEQEELMKENGKAKLLMLRSVKKDLERLSDRGFPLPDTLTLTQWGRLLSLYAYDHRVHYLDSINFGQEEKRFESIKASDEKHARGLRWRYTTKFMLKLKLK